MFAYLYWEQDTILSKNKQLSTNWKLELAVNWYLLSTVFFIFVPFNCNVIRGVVEPLISQLWCYICLHFQYLGMEQVSEQTCYVQPCKIIFLCNQQRHPSGFLACVKWFTLYQETVVQQIALLSYLPGISILVHFSEEMDKEGTLHPLSVPLWHTAALLQFQTAPRFEVGVLMLQRVHTAHMGIAAWAGSTWCFYLKMCKIPPTST